MMSSTNMLGHIHSYLQAHTYIYIDSLFSLYRQDLSAEVEMKDEGHGWLGRPVALESPMVKLEKRQIGV